MWLEKTTRIRKIGNQELVSLAFVPNLNEDQLALHRDVEAVLQHCEIIAVAIRQGAIHEKTYREWADPAFLYLWKKLESYVIQLRTESKQPTAYKYFQELAEKWEKENPSEKRS